VPPTLRALALVSVALLAGPSAEFATAQELASPLLQNPVDESNRLTLRGNVHPLAQRLAQTENDLGPVDSTLPLDRMELLLKRSPAREQALAQFLRDVQTPGAPGYHQWLTPEEFGARFGPADSDLAPVTAWLESHGFAVEKLHPGRIAIEFSGTASLIQEAFHTEIHAFHVRNRKTGTIETRLANVADPQIPAALSSLVAGVASLNSFHATPLVKPLGKTAYNPKTHEAKADWTYPSADVYELTPADFAVQYDIAPVYKAGTTGTGQTIGILSASNVDLSLVAAYRKLFGLAANLPAVVVDGDDPGQNAAATEAYLDLEQSGAVAPAASVILYTSAGSILTDPLLTSALRAVDDNLVTVLSLSYTNCEAALGASGNALWAALWQEAAAQGITAFVSAGDGGSASCDDFDTQAFAESGLAVNGLGSTPYNVSVGGTDFYFSDYAAAASTLNTEVAAYWSASSTKTPAVSLLKAAPEQVWNNAFGFNATDRGLYDPANSTIVAGGGGASAAALYPADGPPTGYAKPAWQAGAGVPADKVRDLPDLSLFASNGQNFVNYPICAEPGDCVNLASNGAVTVTSVGGTSASAPAMAAIQALVNQTQKTRQGQANTVYYALASKSLAAKPFRDIAIGGNEVPCYAGTSNCLLATSGQAKGQYAENGYAATAGYDRASGLGSVDVANLIANWSEATFKPTAATLSIAPATFAHGKSATVKATVAPTSGSGSPTGSVALESNDSVAYASGLGVFALTAGSLGAGGIALETLPGGTYQIVAQYSGDSIYAASVSAPFTVTVTPEKATLATSGWVLNPADGNLYPLSAGMFIPYGAQVFLDTQPIGVNETNMAVGKSTPATGAIAFTDKSGTTTQTAAIPLNDQGLAEWSPASLAVGAHTIAATYAGDASYAAATAASAATLTVFKGATTISLLPLETSVAAGGNVTVDLLLSSDYRNLTGTLPTGTLTVTLGGQSQTVASPFKTWGPTGNATQEAVVTFPKVPAGILPLTASYSGDANWNPTAALYGSVESLATLPAPSVTLTATAAAYTPNQTVTLTGTVTGIAGNGAPSGSLYVTSQGGNSVFSGALQTKTSGSSSWTLTLPAWNLANGTNTFLATFHGDSHYSAQSSAPLLLTFNGSDFSLTTTTQEVAAAPGKSATGTVEIAPIDAYDGAVAIACSAPTGIACSAVTAAPTVGSGVSDNIAIKVATSGAAGTYPAIVTATGGGHTHTAQILIAVN